MNCFKCQTPLPDGAKFCFTCGTDVSGEHGHEKTLAVEQDPELLLKLQADVGTEYVIEKELGRGGMAIVFLGRDASLGRKVAVKLLPPELTFTSGSIIERFKREARTSATLDHPNIIPVYRVSQGKKLFWYVMKFLDGEALDRILEREGQLSVERAVDIVRQTADALDYAHQHQVIHRDIKPANLVIDASGRVTVTDFGIAKALDAATLTATGSMIGTPYYMSPEQCSGKRVGPASDQYSLGVMTYQMLGGHLPFTGDSVVDIVRKHVMDPVPPLGVLRPQLPAPLVAVVERALAKHPEERFRTCSEYAKALAQAAQGLDVSIAPPSKPAAERSSATLLVSPVPGVLRTAKGTWASRKVVVAAALVAIVGAVAGTYYALSRRAAPTAPSSEETTQPGGAATGQPIQLAAGDSAARPAASSPAETTAATQPRSARPPAGAPASKRPAAAQPPQQQRNAATPPAGAAPAPGAPLVSQAAQPTANQPVTGGAPAAPAAPAAAPSAATTGFITIGSTPMSAMTINGRPVTNPVSNLEVPAGTVRVHFQVSDSTGVWTRDTVLTIGAGERRTFGRIRLARHP